MASYIAISKPATYAATPANDTTFMSDDWLANARPRGGRSTPT